jgi:hypothetical protein
MSANFHSRELIVGGGNQGRAEQQVLSLSFSGIWHFSSFVMKNGFLRKHSEDRENNCAVTLIEE